MPWQSHRPIYRDGRTFSAVNMWVFLVSQKEMRHLASQDMSLPYPSEDQFKNRSVDEGHMWATKSTERKNRYVKPPDKAENKAGPPKTKISTCPPAYCICITYIWCTDTILIHQIGLFSPLCWPSIPSSVKQPLGVTHVRTCVGLRWGGGVLCWELTG